MRAIKKEEKTPQQILCEELEHWETPEWAARAILSKEILTRWVVDPCAGTGILARQAKGGGHHVLSIDIHDWGYDVLKADWLNPAEHFSDISGTVQDATVFMNPPFSLSERFVDQSFELGARKIVCFQKFSWYEGSYDTGKKRGTWWEKRPPARIWVCGDRADCWRHDIPKDKRTSSTPTTYAWFVWERGHAPAAITGHIYKGDAK